MDMYDIAVTQSARGALYDFFDVDIADVDDWTPRIIRCSNISNSVWSSIRIASSLKTMTGY